MHFHWLNFLWLLVFVPWAIWAPIRLYNDALYYEGERWRLVLARCVGIRVRPYGESPSQWEER